MFLNFCNGELFAPYKNQNGVLYKRDDIMILSFQLSWNAVKVSPRIQVFIFFILVILIFQDSLLLFMICIPERKTWRVVWTSEQTWWLMRGHTTPKRKTSTWSTAASEKACTTRLTSETHKTSTKRRVRILRSTPKVKTCITSPMINRLRTSWGSESTCWLRAKSRTIACF